MVFTFGSFQVRIERLPAAAKGRDAAPSGSARAGQGVDPAERALAEARAEQHLERQRQAAQRWHFLNHVRHF